MSIQLTSTNQANAESGIKILIHGLAGVGKTRLAATTGGTTAIISAESGLLSLSDVDIPVITVQSLADVVDAYNFVRDSQEAKGIDWIILDSLSEIAEKALASEKAHAKDPRQAYGALQDIMADLVRSFRDLHGKHVYMIAKQERIKDEQTGTFLYAPMMPGSKVAQGLPYFFDEVFALRAERDPNDMDKIVRFFQTQRDFVYEAKDRSGKLSMYEPADMAHIRNKILGKGASADAVPNMGPAAAQQAQVSAPEPESEADQKQAA